MGGFEQRPWTPTKRRGPIAAEMQSPGPACVQLPQLLGKRHLNLFKNKLNVSQLRGMQYLV